VPNSDEQGLTTPAPAPDGARAGENRPAATPPARRPRVARPRRATSEASAAAAALGAALPDLAARAAPAASSSAPARIPRRRGNSGRTALPAVPATAIDAPVVAPDLVEIPGVPAATTEAPALATPAAAAPQHRRGISPENTIFVSLCFEGPDVYSTAGGLGTRVTELTESLAGLGYETHLIFVGDPTAPSVEERVGGKLRLERWSQWISRYHLNGVYDGEERKLYDYNESVPRHVYYDIVAPAIAAGKLVVIIGEDWHTAEAICRVSDLLHWHGVRQRCILMWNCNSLMSLHRINWGRLNYCATITTVSRYMKHRLWQYNINPLAIPNGIPSRYLAPIDQARAAELREIMRRGDPDRLFLFKIGRFDPDKRWLMAVEAVARLKYSGHPVAMVIRGGMEPHGAEVLMRAHYLGLRIQDVDALRPSVADCLRLMREADEADIYNLRFFVPTDFVRLCYAAADATLANSGHEPFGLVGLEVMAAEGIAFTGSTGEDYAVSFENAVALETDDPEEIVGYLLHMERHPEERDKVRHAGKQTASEFTWEEVIDNLTGKLGYLARKQGITFD